jgi:ABC-type sugar transport system permease subunit
MLCMGPLSNRKGDARMSAITTSEEVQPQAVVRPSFSRITRLRKWLGGSFAPYAFVSPFFILFAAFSIYPLLYALWLSFTYWHGDGDPRFVGLSNYTFLLTDNFFWQSIGNSVYVWLLVVPAQTIVAVVVAVLLSRATLRFRWFFRTAFLTPFLVPLVAIALVWQVLFDQQFGAVNALLQIIHLPAIGWLTTAEWSKPTMSLLVLWEGSGFAILLMLAAIQGIPQDYYEAAALDGANSFRQLWHITIPLLRRTISFFVVIQTLAIIQMFLEPYVLTQGGPFNSTTTAGYNLLSYINNGDFGTGAANSFLLMVIVFVVSIVMLRMLRAGGES